MTNNPSSLCPKGYKSISDLTGVPELHEAVKDKAAELGTSINAFLLAAAKSALGWQAPVDSVKMLKLIGNLESRINDLEKELAGLRKD